MNTQEQDRARAYADAFYEAALQRWLTVLESVAGKVAGDWDLLSRLQASDTEFSARQPLLNSLLPADVDAPVRNLFYTLMQREDLGLLPDIAVAFHGRMVLGAAEAVRVEVVSAVPLAEQERAALSDRLAVQYSSELEFHYRVDPSILGGLIVRVGDKLIDGSVASRLAAMKQALGVTNG